MLLDAETRYSVVEKMMLALVNTKKKLRHYFETHQIIVITDFPIKQIPSKPDLIGRLTKWTIDLGVCYKKKFQVWVRSTDGASNSVGAGIGIVLEAPSGLKMEKIEFPSDQ